VIGGGVRVNSEEYACGGGGGGGRVHTIFKRL